MQSFKPYLAKLIEKGCLITYNNKLLTPDETEFLSTTRTITDFLNTEYREFSNYVIATRALPALDGLKVGARKALYSAFTGGLKDGSEKKMLNLIGDVYNKTLFAHGDAGLLSSIHTLGSEYSDNLNPLEIVGQHGNLRDNSKAAARYLYCKLSKYAKLIYKVDEDLLEYVFDEGEFLEPINYLPIIPLVLTSRNEGMAPGYKFSSFSYNSSTVLTSSSINPSITKTVLKLTSETSSILSSGSLVESF